MSGRIPGVGLNAQGRAQVRRLAERLTARKLAALYSSPLQRALDTAAILGPLLSLPVQSAPDLREVDFGEWTDRPFDELQGDPAWQAFHQQRPTAPVPGGELMVQVQARALDCLLQLSERHRDGAVVAVSHADVIRSVVIACLGAGLDAMLRLTVDPASVTEVALGEHLPAVVRVNDTAHLFSPPSSAG